jgi:hypothetical protein
MASEQETKLLFVKDILGLEMLRFHHYKIKIDRQAINDLFVKYMEKDMETLKYIYEFLSNWVEENFHYESGSDDDM